MKSAMETCKCRLRDSEVRGGRLPASGAGPRQTPRGTGHQHGCADTRHQDRLSDQDAILRPLPPCSTASYKSGTTVGLQTFPLPWPRAGVAGSRLGSVLLPKPSQGVRRCLGSCDTSAEGDPLMQPPSRKLDPDLEGLNLLLSSLRNHFQWAEIPVPSNRWYEASNKHSPNPSPARSGQEQGLWQQRWGNPARTNPQHLLNPLHMIITPASRRRRAPRCLPCCAPRLQDIQLRPSPCRLPSGPPAALGHRRAPATDNGPCVPRPGSVPMPHAHMHARTHRCHRASPPPTSACQAGGSPTSRDR